MQCNEAGLGLKSPGWLKKPPVRTLSAWEIFTLTLRADAETGFSFMHFVCKLLWVSVNFVPKSQNAWNIGFGGRIFWGFAPVCATIIPLHPPLAGGCKQPRPPKVQLADSRLTAVQPSWGMLKILEPSTSHPAGGVCFFTTIAQEYVTTLRLIPMCTYVHILHYVIHIYYIYCM